MVDEFHKAMDAAGKSNEIGFVTLEGYLAGKTFCTIAKSVEGELTREAFLAAVPKHTDLDLGGITLHYGVEDHQGMDEVFLTMFDGGKIVRLTSGAQLASGK